MPNHVSSSRVSQRSKRRSFYSCISLGLQKGSFEGVCSSQTSVKYPTWVIHHLDKIWSSSPSVCSSSNPFLACFLIKFDPTKIHHANWRRFQGRRPQFKWSLKSSCNQRAGVQHWSHHLVKKKVLFYKSSSFLPFFSSSCFLLACIVAFEALSGLRTALWLGIFRF